MLSILLIYILSLLSGYLILFIASKITNTEKVSELKMKTVFFIWLITCILSISIFLLYDIESGIFLLTVSIGFHAVTFVLDLIYLLFKRGQFLRIFFLISIGINVIFSLWIIFPQLI